jgi:hypothetical protein
MNQEILKVFQDQKIVHNLRNEIIEKFRPYHIRGFQIIHYNRFHILKDSFPIAFVIQVPFHPKVDLTHKLPKELVFQTFQNTILENVQILIKGDTIA